MKDPAFYVSSLLDLAEASGRDRRALWRQAMAALSKTAPEGPGLLEGLRPDVLAKGVRAAMEDGLVDDLDWLAPSAAGIALYTLASALPSGPEQRDLGRRVLARMLSANAETFLAIATAMAQSGGKGLSTPAIRARVSLVCELPLGHSLNDGPLALALVSRRELAREWITLSSTQSMPSRRFAAKLIERAAFEGARRAQTGDSQALRFFASDTVRGAWSRLIADREPLVWRYVAIARGLCAAWLPEVKQQILDGLAEGMSPNDWRRAATSLAAFGSVDPEQALAITQTVIKRGLFAWEDPASASAFVWGITRTIESEPEAAEKMLEAVMTGTPPEIAEAVAELRFENGQSDIVTRAEARALQLLKSDKRRRLGPDDGADALFQDIARDLELQDRDDPPLRVQVAKALDAFVTDGALAAHGKIRATLASAKGAVDTLEAIAEGDDAEGKAGEIARRTSMTVLRDLDLALFERNVVADLLKLGSGGDQVRAAEGSLDAIRERFAEWIVTCETTQDKAQPTDGRPRQPTLRLRRMRALLHLVDGEIEDGADVQRTERVRALWIRTVRALLLQFGRDPVPVLRRTILASIARALDALVALDVCAVADALLVLAQRIHRAKDFAALAEASLDPDLRNTLTRYTDFLTALTVLEAMALDGKGETADSIYAPSIIDARRLPAWAGLEALKKLINELDVEASARTDALRTVLVRLQDALTSITGAGSLNALAAAATSETDPVEALETWTGALAQMTIGASARLDPDGAPAATGPRRMLSAAIGRILGGAEPAEALTPAVDELVFGLPHGLAQLVAGLVLNLVDVPLARPQSIAPPMHHAERLPAWLPARRTIGGFYVVRALGAGGTASVLVVNRVEDRHDPSAERFALKVPDYNATAARSVTQEQFLKLFRDEASALIMLPNHANLARFVTFDLSARPLPILVMELVEGITLERVIDTQAFDTKRALEAMDGILAGLEAMHEVATGHLDIKPSNVLLRRGEQAVLVDFGLSGRRIRPGCGTGPYGAPEVWGVQYEGLAPTPLAADVYSFACVAFEMLTGRVLFDASNEQAQVNMHASHDGSPQGMLDLAANPEVGPLAEILMRALRHDPRNRPTAGELRREIRSVASMVIDAKWPIKLPEKKAPKLELVLDTHLNASQLASD